MQKEALNSIFLKGVRAGQTVTMAEVKKLVAGHQILSVLTHYKTRLKQVVNYLNYKARSSAAKTTPPSTVAPVATKVTDWLSQTPDRPTRASVRRHEWDPEDEKVLTAAFKKYTTLPKTDKIRNILASDPDLKFILDREGWSQVYNKLKNMYCAKK